MQKRWTKELVRRTKLAVKAELDAAGSVPGSPGRLRLAVKQVAGLGSEHDVESDVRRYVLAMSALVHHERSGGLKREEVSRLGDIIEAILRTSGVPPVSSPLSFLHGEYHLMMSQVLRRQGDNWESTWEQLLSWHKSRREPVGGIWFQEQALGIRSLRLGLGDYAVSCFENASAHASGPEARRARIRLAHALRLSGRLGEARDLAARLAADPEIGDNDRLDIEWEGICLDASETGNLGPMVNAVRRGRRFFRNSYVLETVLWTRAVSGTEWEKRLSRLSTLAKDKTLRLTHAGALLEFVRQIQRCYDGDVPFETRLRELGSPLGAVNELISVDTELLFLAAAARWLARNRSLIASALILRRYQALSFSLSAGASRDTLGVVGDLLDRPWCRRGIETGGANDRENPRNA